jgi:agmatine/peptidylarginine deiminase
LDRAFRAETVIIPWDRHEPYGHADGMVRYIGNDKVLITNYYDFDKGLRKKLLDALQPHFEVVELYYDTPRPHKWNWAYINFLLTDGKVFLPRLNAPEDEQACAQIGSALGVPREHIELVDITGVLRNGGGLNCISWNVSLYDSIL